MSCRATLMQQLFSKLRFFFFFRVSFLRAADANHATAECVTNNNLCTVLGKTSTRGNTKNQKTSPHKRSSRTGSVKGVKQ